MFSDTTAIFFQASSRLSDTKDDRRSKELLQMDQHAKRQFSLLMVDDDQAILSSLQRIFRKAPYEIHTAQNGMAAMEILEQKPIDAVLVDLKMPEMDGKQLLGKIKAGWPGVQVVMLTGYGGVNEAVEAIKLGATDFLQKPFEAEAIDARINQIYHIWRLEQENQRLKDQVQLKFGYDPLIGNSTVMLQMKKMIMQVAGSDAPVLIQGETGTGKELVARAIHHQSPRSRHSFVAVDCASISETVMGSELFGHVKGAFTGAHESTKGLIRSADKGTLFLDEVGELSLSMQVKLLRSIQEREVRPVGASQNYPVDVRILAATNRNLEEEVAQGRFRQDLYYRLNVVVLGVPSLETRLEDIPLLARYFIQQFATPASTVQRISNEALGCLSTYDWPGNVRELENVIRRAVAMGQEESIKPRDLPEGLNGGGSLSVQGSDSASRDSLEAYEQAAIRNALLKCGGHRKKAARMLGIGEATLYRKLNKYQISGT
jgi:DNA-binding NtrC family response regulator